jgi:flagellar motor switch protein FliM
MSPLDSKVLVHIDHVIAHHIIDRLLGGSGDISPEVRLLTEAEIGVLQYLIMQLLMRLHAVCGHDERIHFRFEQVLQRSENLVPLVPSKGDGVVITVRLGFADHVGFVRLLFPNPFISEAMVEPLRLPETAGERRYWKTRMEAFGNIKASVWAEAGVVTIHPDELRNLEVGDVVLLDESDVRLKNKAVEGDLKLRVGDGQHGWARARVDVDQETLHCTIENIEVGG